LLTDLIKLIIDRTIGRAVVLTNKFLQKSRPRDAAYDLDAAETLTVNPNESKLVSTGYKISLPKNHCAFVMTRSGMAYKHNLSVLNSPGLIDENYRGDIGVILYNHGTEPYTVNKGDRVAQLLIVKIPRIRQSVGRLPKSERGEQGFGSSGR